MLWFILWLIAVGLWVFVVVDVVRRDDLTTMVKLTWIVLALVLPYLGVVAYFVARWQTQRAAGVRWSGDANASRPADSTTVLSKNAALTPSLDELCASSVLIRRTETVVRFRIETGD